MTEEIELRPGVPGDAEEIAGVHVRAWRESYPGIVPQALLDRWHEVVSVDRWREILAQDRSTLAVLGDRIVGWSTGGPPRDEDPPQPLELYALYTLREVQGRGVGRRLLEAAIGADAGAYLWVLAENERAIAFYRGRGFVPDQTVKVRDIEGFRLLEARMVREPR